MAFTLGHGSVFIPEDDRSRCRPAAMCLVQISVVVEVVNTHNMTGHRGAGARAFSASSLAAARRMFPRAYLRSAYSCSTTRPQRLGLSARNSHVQHCHAGQQLATPKVMASSMLRRSGMPSRLSDPLFGTSCAGNVPIDVLTAAKRFFHSRATTREVAVMLQRQSLPFAGLGMYPAWCK